MPGRFKHLPAELQGPFRGIRPFGPYRLTCGDRVSIRRLRDWVASSDGLRGDFELITIEVKKSSGQFHHRGLTENDIKLSADDAARLFKPDSTYTVELFEV